MSKKKGMSFDEFRYECMEFYRQRMDYYKLIDPSVMQSLPDDAIDRGIWYFRIYIGNHATSKILMYNHQEDEIRNFAVYEEWIDANPMKTESVVNKGIWEDTTSQLILFGEYANIHEAFSNMCMRGEYWRWAQYNLLHIDLPETDLPYNHPLAVRTRQILLPSYRYTLSKFIQVLRENKDEILKGKYEIYTKNIGNFKQSHYTFNNK